MSTARSIVVEDLGPTGNFVVPVQPGGTIITGYCGKGKSITLEAIALGLGSRERGRVAPRNGTKRGRVDCLGVVLTVSAGRISRSGESDVASNEEFDVGTLIDPPVKEDEARNRHGIKSLLRMTKAEANPELFYHLAGGKQEFEALIDPDAVKSSDLVDMAGKIKRAFESEKRKIDGHAEREEAAAAADRNAADGLDLNAETNAALLQAAYGDAVAKHSKLQEQCDRAQAAEEAAEDARAKLAAATGDESMSMDAAQRSLDEATKNQAEAMIAQSKAQREVDLLEAALQAAKKAKTAADANYQSASLAVIAAQRGVKAVEANQRAYAGWQSAIDAAANVACPEMDEIITASQAVKLACKAIEQAAVVRAAKDRVAKAKAHQEAAAKLRKRAFQVQQAAWGTDGVLSAAVASERFSVENGVLMGKLPDGQTKPYFDLSDGERTLIATAEKIDRVRLSEPDATVLGIIDLPQRTFQDIPGSVREMLFQRAAEKNCCVVTAQVNDDEELKAEVWQPGMFFSGNGHAAELVAAAG